MVTIDSLLRTNFSINVHFSYGWAFGNDGDYDQPKAQVQDIRFVKLSMKDPPDYGPRNLACVTLSPSLLLQYGPSALRRFFCSRSSLSCLGLLLAIILLLRETRMRSSRRSFQISNCFAWVCLGSGRNLLSGSPFCFEKNFAVKRYSLEIWSS